MINLDLQIQKHFKQFFLVKQFIYKIKRRKKREGNRIWGGSGERKKDK